MECYKEQNRNRDLVEDVKRIQRSGLQVQGGFIVGFDNDPPSIFQRQIDFIQKSGIVTAMVGLLQAPTGTKLYERLKTRGVLVVPGSHFFYGLQEDWRHSHECIRLTFSQSEETVRGGIGLLAEEVKRAYGPATPRAV